MISTHITFNRFLAEYRLSKMAYHLSVNGTLLIELLMSGFTCADICKITGWKCKPVNLYISALEIMVLSDGHLSWSEVTATLPAEWLAIAESLEKLALLRLNGKITNDRYQSSCSLQLIKLDLPKPSIDWITYVSNRILLEPVILDFLVNGTSGIRKAYGVTTDNPFELYESHPKLMTVYAEAFSRSNTSDAELFERIDDSIFTNVLDVGGGSGSTLVNLLKSRCANEASATIYDYPGSTSTLAQTRKNILKDINQKVAFVEGNFLSRGTTLENLEKNVSFDLIVLGWILHDWPDNISVQLLRKLHSCLKENGKLFILEDIKAEKSEVISNLIMFLMMKGQERSLSQFKRIFRDAKFKIEKILTPTSGSRSLLVLSRL